MAQNEIVIPYVEPFHYIHDSAGREKLHQLRQAGLHRDAAKIPLLLETILKPADGVHFFAAMHALGKIGEVTVVPTIEDVINRLDSANCRDYAHVVRARLIASDHGRLFNDPKIRARACLSSFLKELNFTPASLNEAVRENLREMNSMTHGTYNGATWALFELADMIYWDQDLLLLEEARGLGVQFDVPAGAKYKTQLASLTREQCVDWIIDHQSNRSTGTPDAYFLIQLAANEGTTASRKAAARLKEMEKDRRKFAIVHPATDKRAESRSYPGFVAMLQIIGCVGDKEMEPMMRAYAGDPEDWIQNYADQEYPRVQSGIPGSKRIAY